MLGLVRAAPRLASAAARRSQPAALATTGMLLLSTIIIFSFFRLSQLFHHPTDISTHIIITFIPLSYHIDGHVMLCNGFVNEKWG
jgi:hypothetical protein